jgi:hypothetical protein
MWSMPVRWALPEWWLMKDISTFLKVFEGYLSFPHLIPISELLGPAIPRHNFVADSLIRVMSKQYTKEWGSADVRKTNYQGLTTSVLLGLHQHL